MDNKEKFLELVQEIKREGADKLLAYLEKTDYFYAPASTKYHGSHVGGLLEHSLNVCKCLDEMNQKLPEDKRYTKETIVFTALFHDMCKTNYYKLGSRNVKNEETGKWEAVPTYMVEDLFPAGHGEKSVFLLQQFVKMSKSEILAIRWHMGGYDSAVKGGDFAISKAYEETPLAVMLHLSDMEATYLLEKRENKTESKEEVNA